MKILGKAVLREFAHVSSGWTEIGGRELDACLRDADAVMYRDKNRSITDRLTATAVRSISETQSLEPNSVVAALEGRTG